MRDTNQPLWAVINTRQLNTLLFILTCLNIVHLTLSFLSSDNSHRGGGDWERGAPPLRLPLGGMQGVRQGLQLPQVAREPRAQAWRQVRLPLHCGGMQDEIQLSGQYFRRKYFKNIRAIVKCFVFDNLSH